MADPIDRNAGTLAKNEAAGSSDTPPERQDTDTRSDLEQIVAARSDAVERGEGGPEPETFTDAGRFDGNSGTGGEVKNQDLTAQ